MRQTRSTSTRKRSPLATVVAVLGLVGVVALGVFLVSGAGLNLSALATPTISADGVQDIQPLVPDQGIVDFVFLSSPSVTTGSSFDIQIQAQAGAQMVDTASVYVNYDPAILDVTLIDGTGSPLTAEAFNDINNPAGQFGYAAGRLTGTRPSGNFLIVTISFTAQACGTTTLDFVHDVVNLRDTDARLAGVAVLDDAIDGSVTVTGCATPTNTATNTSVAPTATNTATATNTPVAPTATNTATNTNTPVAPTATNTSTNTPSPVGPTATNTSTSTPTDTVPTATNTNTSTPTDVPPTATNTNTQTPTLFVTNTFTPTPTDTLPPTATFTATNTTVPPTPSNTPTASNTPEPTNTPTEGPSPTASNTPDPSQPTAAPPTGTPVPAEYVACDNIGERTNGAIIAAGGGGIAVIRGTSNTTVAAAGRAKLQQEVGNAYCRPIAVEDVYVTSPEEIGDPGVVSMPVANAVDIFGLLADGTPANTFIRVMQVCFRVTSGELLLFADSAGVPRSYVPLTTYISGEYICGFIGRGGTVVQVDLPN